MHVPTSTLGSPKPTTPFLVRNLRTPSKKTISGSAFLLCVLMLFGVNTRAQNPGVKTTENRTAARMRALNNSVLKIHEQMQQAGPASAPSLRGQASTVLGQRAAVLQKLIENDPHAALTFAFSDELIAELAWKFPEGSEYLEKHATISGRVDRWTIDYPGNKPAKTILRLVNKHHQTLDLYLDGSEPKDLTNGTVVEATGVVSGYAMAVSSVVVAPSDSLTSGGSATAASCSKTGVQNTAVILATLPGVTLPNGLTNSGLFDTFFNSSSGRSLDGFLRDASYGQASATGNVFGPYTLNGTYSSCTDVGGTLLNDAIAAATANGANFNNYSRIFLVFPDNFGCGWAGFASNSCTVASSSGTFNSSVAYIAANYAVPRDQGVQVASHELGHNMDLLHSGTVSAGTDVMGPVGSAGTKTDSGDYWSTMGESVLGLYPAPQKAEVLGWLPQSGYQTVQSSGTYTIQPLESSPSGVQALRVQRGTGNNEWLWIEYRQPIGNYDSTLISQAFSGALIHFEDSNTALGHTYLVNFNPVDTAWNSPALSPGQTWTDPYSDLSISVIGATTSGLTVQVNFGGGQTPLCVPANPTLIASPLDPTIIPGGSASYALSVKNNDSSACAGRSFALDSTQPSGWPTSFTTTSVSLAPGQSYSLTMSKTGPSGTAPGTYGVNARATNNTSTGSATANVTVMSVPSVAATLTVSSTTYSRKSTVPITVSVTNGGVAVSGASVKFTITKPDGTTSTQTATTSNKGTAVWNYKLSPKYPAGGYSAIAQVTIASTGAASTQTVVTNTATFAVQ